MNFRLRTALAATILAIGSPSTVLASDGFWTRSYQPEQPLHKVETSVARFNRFDGEAQADATKIPDYIRSGIVMSDLACEN